MTKFALVCPFAAVLFVPLFAAAFLASAQTPAVGQQLRATQCSTAAPPATGRWRPPFQQQYTLGDGFGRLFDPTHKRWQRHPGQNLTSLPGPGPVVAAAAGTVIRAGTDGGPGNTVVLDNGHGITTLYAHLANIDTAVVHGATVRMGQRLGAEGSTGHSTGDGLDYEIQRNGTPIDPVPFMLDHGAPLDGHAIAPSAPPPSDSPPSATDPPATGPPDGEGGVRFPLPDPRTPRQDSLTNPPLPIPADVKADYVRAADRYQLPWTLLAGIGMEETSHGRKTGTSSAGAEGLMQFMPATWAQYGVDGDADGHANITDDADSAMSAANYLTATGVSTGGADGVRRALFAYNHADWYVNDVLYYAQAYGGGEILGDPSDCGGSGDGNPNLPPLTNERVTTLLTWAESKVGDPYVFGADGPNTWDCSGFTQAAFAQIGITIPRTAAAQRDWLAAGNGFRVPYGHEEPGDMIFTDTYLGPNTIGHVMLVYNPTQHLTIEAGGDHVDNYDYTQYTTHHIFEIWRVGNLSDDPTNQQ